MTVKRTRLVLLDCTPGFAGRAIQQHSLVRFTVISHTPVRSRYNNVLYGDICSSSQSVGSGLVFYEVLGVKINMQVLKMYVESFRKYNHRQLES